MLNTCSALISFYERLEDNINIFYTKLGEQFPEKNDFFNTLSKENIKHKQRVVRTYREVITDAIEACFISEIDDNKHRIDTEISEQASLTEAIEKAIQIEEKSREFCAEAVNSSEGLLHDITRSFERVARDKNKRIEKLKQIT
jgi:hypothetical protein